MNKNNKSERYKCTFDVYNLDEETAKEYHEVLVNDYITTLSSLRVPGEHSFIVYNYFDVEDTTIHGTMYIDTTNGCAELLASPGLTHCLNEALSVEEDRKRREDRLKLLRDYYIDAFGGEEAFSSFVHEVSRKIVQSVQEGYKEVEDIFDVTELDSGEFGEMIDAYYPPDFPELYQEQYEMIAEEVAKEVYHISDEDIVAVDYIEMGASAKPPKSRARVSFRTIR